MNTAQLLERMESRDAHQRRSAGMDLVLPQAEPAVGGFRFKDSHFLSLSACITLSVPSLMLKQIHGHA